VITLGKCLLPLVSATISSSLLSEQLKINPLNAKLNPICHLLVLAGAHHFVDVSRIRAKIQSYNSACSIQVPTQTFKTLGWHSTFSACFMKNIFEHKKIEL
jgi:hypothetical protein